MGGTVYQYCKSAEDRHEEGVRMNELTVKEVTALSPDGFGLTAEEIAEELGGDVPVYPRIKIPAGGSVAFEVQGDDPDNPDITKEISGIVVWHHKTNAYWKSQDDDNMNTPPDCISNDGKFGRGKPGGSCAYCPLNEFGSGEGGKGKACKNTETLYILQRDGLLPVILQLPPTSLKGWRTYKTMLISKGKKVCSVETAITLKKMSNGKQDYSVAVFKVNAALDPETKGAAESYRSTVKAMVAEMEAQVTHSHSDAGLVIDDDFVEVLDDDDTTF